MLDIKFKKIYEESRNGANHFIRHPLVRSFAISDGMHDAAETGIWWLVDIAATELPAVLKKSGQYMGVLICKVKKGKATLTMTGAGDVKLWSRRVDYTDMPDGTWNFFVTSEEGGDRMILPTEY